MDADALLTSHQVGALLQVNPSSVKKWVNEGRITAFRTPGGHRRIRVGDLVAFLDRHEMPIPAKLAGVTRPRLLVVDDDQVHLRSFERRLRPHKSRLELQMTDNGIDALVTVGSFKPNLIVLDVYMPELDGLEVCRRLKLKPETSSIGVIIHTAHLTREVAETAAAAGAIAAVAKPIELKLVLEHLGLIQQHLGG
jgi:excisionase family DNA binding protein